MALCCASGCAHDCNLKSLCWIRSVTPEFLLWMSRWGFLFQCSWRLPCSLIENWIIISTQYRLNFPSHHSWSSWSLGDTDMLLRWQVIRGSYCIYVFSQTSKWAWGLSSGLLEIELWENCASRLEAKHLSDRIQNKSKTTNQFCSEIPVR